VGVHWPALRHGNAGPHATNPPPAAATSSPTAGSFYDSDDDDDVAAPDIHCLHDEDDTDHSPDDDVAVPIRIPVLLETDRVLVVHKPAGIPHHNEDDDVNSLGIVNCIRRQRRWQQQQQQETQHPNTHHPHQERLFGVHRLDRVTSGILVLGKDQEMAASLSRAFRNGHVVKYYVGLSSIGRHRQQKKQGWVRGGMVRGRRKSWYLTRDHLITPNATTTTTTTADQRDGNPRNSSSSSSRSTNFASTRFFTAGLGHLLSAPRSTSDDDVNYISNNDNTGRSTGCNLPRTLLLFRPYTGKTHQLRVAARSVGLPLLGDPIYSSSSSWSTTTTANKNNKNQGSTGNADDENDVGRTYLHAMGLHIPAEYFATSSKEYDDHDVNNSHSKNGLTVWCPPPFESAWSENVDSVAGFRTALRTLMERHCDCPELMALLARETIHP
jgi:23S rRNA-/tRNA-specific pseudouridylate synthase